MQRFSSNSVPPSEFLFFKEIDRGQLQKRRERFRTTHEEHH